MGEMEFRVMSGKGMAEFRDKDWIAPWHNRANAVVVPEKMPHEMVDEWKRRFWHYYDGKTWVLMDHWGEGHWRRNGGSPMGHSCRRGGSGRIPEMLVMLRYSRGFGWVVYHRFHVGLEVLQREFPCHYREASSIQAFVTKGLLGTGGKKGLGRQGFGGRR